METDELAVQRMRVLNNLNALVGRKLEDKVLEIIDLPSGKTDKNILEYIRIAEEYNNSTAVSLLKEIVYEIGVAQVQKSTIPKKKKSKLEAELEDWLELGNNIEGIEQGLKYQSRQYIVKTGIIDTRASDAQDLPVSIELKMAKYVSRDVFFQLMKYMNERKDERFIFVAPEIKPDLFYALKNYFDNGGLSYYRVKKEGDIFLFSPVDESNLDSAKHMNLDFTSKGSNSADGGDIITVVDGHNKGVGVASVEIKKPDDSLIEVREDDPLFLRYFVEKGMPLEEAVRYREPIYVDEQKYAQLRRLVNVVPLERLLEKTKEVNSLDFPEEYLKGRGKGGLIDMYIHVKKTLLDQWKNVQSAVNEVFESESEFLSKLDALEKEVYALKQSIAIEEAKPEYQKVMKFLKRSIRQGGQTDDETVYKKFKLFPIKLMVEAYQVNIRRTRALYSVDNQLGKNFFYAIHSQKSVIDDGISADTQYSVLSCFEEAKSVYQDIVDHFLIGSYISEPPLAGYDTEHKERPERQYEPLMFSVFKNKKHFLALSQNMQDIYNGFVDQLEINEIPEESIESLARSFEAMNPWQHLRKRENRPHEQQWDAFFDDIIGDLLRGRVPDEGKLNQHYENALKIEVKVD